MSILSADNLKETTCKKAVNVSRLYARQVKMLIDSRPRLERVRKLQRRLRSLFVEVTSKGIGREILARSQYAWLGHVLKARHTASKSNVPADFAIKSTSLTTVIDLCTRRRCISCRRQRRQTLQDWTNEKKLITNNTKAFWCEREKSKKRNLLKKKDAKVFCY